MRFLEAKNVENVFAVFNHNCSHSSVLFLGFAFLCLFVYFFVFRTLSGIGQRMGLSNRTGLMSEVYYALLS